MVSYPKQINHSENGSFVFAVKSARSVYKNVKLIIHGFRVEKAHTEVSEQSMTSELMTVPSRQTHRDLK